MFSLLHAGCTRPLDSAILAERVRYAAERLDFETFLPHRSIPEVLRILRGEPGRDSLRSSRRDLVVDLLWAQQESPHRLWTLLLTQAFEDDLVKRRRALRGDEDPALDDLILGTFLGALEAIPCWVVAEDLRKHVLCVWQRALARALRDPQRPAARRVTAPPASGVDCVAQDDAADSSEVA